MSDLDWKRRIRRERSASAIEKRLATAYIDPPERPCPTCGAGIIQVELDDPALAGLAFMLEPGSWGGEYALRPTGWKYVGGMFGTHTEHRCSK